MSLIEARQSRGPSRRWRTGLTHRSPAIRAARTISGGTVAACAHWPSTPPRGDLKTPSLALHVGTDGSRLAYRFMCRRLWSAQGLEISVLHALGRFTTASTWPARPAACQRHCCRPRLLGPFPYVLDQRDSKKGERLLDTRVPTRHQLPDCERRQPGPNWTRVFWGPLSTKRRLGKFQSARNGGAMAASPSVVCCAMTVGP